MAVQCYYIRKDYTGQMGEKELPGMVNTGNATLHPLRPGSCPKINPTYVFKIGIFGEKIATRYVSVGGVMLKTSI